MRRVAAFGRVLPVRLAGGSQALALVERNLLVFRRGWLLLLSGAVEPLLYLYAVGVGIGALVGDVPGPRGPIAYEVFVAPALLAASAMNGAAFETYNVFFKMRHERLYDAALAAPLRPRDVARGEITWALLRGALYAAGFLAVAAVAGLLRSPWAVLALPAALLVGYAFAALTMAGATYMRSWQDFDLLLVALVPMFLFSATFYPLDAVPPELRWLPQVSPLYHGVQLIRGLVLGAIDVRLLAHAGVLFVLGAAGSALSSRRLARVLLQ